MRQRKVKNLEVRLEELDHLIVKEPQSYKGDWKSLFENDNDIYMELGCGKGQFITTQARKYPDKNFIAVEGQDTVILRALEKAEEQKLTNIRFVCCYINDVGEFFTGGELSGIYLNFSDPWPKDRHAKRRLTHTNYLKGYESIVKDSGSLEFKTDNDGLFEFSVNEVKKNGYRMLEYTTDLHSSGFLAKYITTEYEEKFKALGKNINYMKIVY